MALAFVENEIVTAYPIGSVEIKRKFPNTSFSLPLEGQDLSDFGVATIEATPQPIIDSKVEKLEEATPELVDGVWRQKWNVISLTVEEIQQVNESKSSSIRLERNGRLASCDWTQLPDAPVDKAAWASYRQQLRDISSQEGFPWTIIWPDQP